MKKEQVQERILHPANGYLMLLLGILLLIAGIGGGVAGSVIGGMEENGVLIGLKPLTDQTEDIGAFTRATTRQIIQTVFKRRNLIQLRKIFIISGDGHSCDKRLRAGNPFGVLASRLEYGCQDMAG